MVVTFADGSSLTGPVVPCLPADGMHGAVCGAQVAADSVGTPAGSPYAQDSSGPSFGSLLSNPGVRAVAAASLLLAVLTGLRVASGDQVPHMQPGCTVQPVAAFPCMPCPLLHMSYVACAARDKAQCLGAEKIALQNLLTFCAW
jgi:hypothetical protein